MASRTYIAETPDPGDKSTYTFAGASIGSADALRVVVVLVYSRSVTGQVLNSLTIGGNAATKIAGVATGASGTGCSCNIYALAVASGTTADIVATFASGQVRCTIRVYSLVGVDIADITDTGTGIAGNPVSLSLDNAANDLVLAAAANGSSVLLSPSVSGITEDGTRTTNEFLITPSGSDFFGSAATGRTISFGFNLEQNTVAAAASFGLLKPLNTVAPVITQDGLTSAGAWDGRTNGTPTLSYQWEEFIASQWEEVDGQAVAADGPADWGDAVDGRDYRLVETATNSAGSATQVSNTVTYDAGGPPAVTPRRRIIQELIAGAA